MPSKQGELFGIWPSAGHFAWQWVQRGSPNSAAGRVGLHSNGGVLTRVSAQPWLEEAPWHTGGHGSDRVSEGGCCLPGLMSVALPGAGQSESDHGLTCEGRQSDCRISEDR